MSPDDYMSKDGLIAYLKISRTTIGRLMKEGLPHIKLERRVLFRKIDVDRFLSKRLVKR